MTPLFLFHLLGMAAVCVVALELAPSAVNPRPSPLKENSLCHRKSFR
jgi:hypothetical protein